MASDVDPTSEAVNLAFDVSRDKAEVTAEIRHMIDRLGYTVVESDENKPWGAYYRLSSDEADRFVAEYFPRLSATEARLGNDELELSPKFLVVAPGARLSWQLHDRRAERWRFLTPGAYYKSMTDEQGEIVHAASAEVVQFSAGERHRLCAENDQHWTIVAEIWQHIDPSRPSDEADIVRLQDDYKRD